MREGERKKVIETGGEKGVQIESVSFYNQESIWIEIFMLVRGRITTFVHSYMFNCALL